MNPWSMSTRPMCFEWRRLPRCFGSGSVWRRRVGEADDRESIRAGRGTARPLRHAEVGAAAGLPERAGGMRAAAGLLERLAAQQAAAERKRRAPPVGTGIRRVPPDRSAAESSRRGRSPTRLLGLHGAAPVLRRLLYSKGDAADCVLVRTLESLCVSRGGSGVPFSENLPMGTAQESTTERETKHAVSGNGIAVSL